MPHPAFSRRSLIAGAISAALLQACGGGGGGTAGGGGGGGGGGGPATAPAITAQPAAATVLAGAAVTFSVTATGGAPLAYQWLRDGAPIPGAIGPSYTLASPTLADNGAAFAVRVSNAAGAVTSNTALLTVVAGFGIALLAGGLGGNGHLDAAGVAARFDQPTGVAVDAAGNIHVAAANAIRKISPAGVVSTLAGAYGRPGTVDGTGAAARFKRPEGIAFDGAGNLYVTDLDAHVVRKVSSGGAVTTFAGTADSTGSTDATGALARFNKPSGVAVDSAGNVFVTDSANHTIRRITPAGVVTTFAGTAGASGFLDAAGAGARFNRPGGIVIDAADNLYVADRMNHRIRKVTPAGDVSTLAGSGATGATNGTGVAAQFNQPWGLTLAGGVLYVADTWNNQVRAVTLPAAVTSTLAGGLTSGEADGVGADARFRQPTGIAADAAGDLYVSDMLTGTIRKVAADGTVVTFAGRGYHQGITNGVGAAARFLGPDCVAMDGAGNAYVVESSMHTIRKVAPDGTVTTLAGAPGAAGAVDATGMAARFNSPSGVAADGVGNVYVADTNNHLIRKITPAGVVTTLAGNVFGGRADGNGAAASFNQPMNLTVDAAGNVYVSDTGNNTIRKITPAGDVTTLAGTAPLAGATDGVGAAARFYAPRGIAVDAAGSVFVADFRNHLIRRIAPDGTVSTLAGTATVPGSVDGTGAAALLNYPQGLACDGAGNLYVSEIGAPLLRGVTPAGAVATLYGRPRQYGVLTGPAPGAFHRPVSVAVNATGTLLYVVDSAESVVLKITRS